MKRTMLALTLALTPAAARADDTGAPDRAAALADAQDLVSTLNYLSQDAQSASDDASNNGDDSTAKAMSDLSMAADQAAQGVANSVVAKLRNASTTIAQVVTYEQRLQPQFDEIDFSASEADSLPDFITAELNDAGRIRAQLEGDLGDGRGRDTGRGGGDRGGTTTGGDTGGTTGSDGRGGGSATGDGSSMSFGR